jgi:AAA15 family ATPase/GTPase
MTNFKSLVGMDDLDLLIHKAVDANENSSEEDNFFYKRINLFIGPNNSGKSNIFKYFKAIKDGGIDSQNDVFLKGKGYFQEPKDIITLESNRQLSVEFVEGKLDELVIVDNLLPTDEDIKDRFTKSLQFIGNERDDINLVGIWKCPELQKEEYCSRMSTWISKILDETVKVNLDKGEFTITFTIRTNMTPIDFNLTDLGTGVHQSVKILTFLYYQTLMLNHYGITGINFFIEEPETNLHNKAVLSLMNIIITDPLLNKNRYFITTHSSAFLDQLDEDSTITSIALHPEERRTVVKQCSSKDDVFLTLDSLGVKASQILQSNVIIWIEGPSDRIYLNRWIALLSPELLEGKHFSYMMYGGSLLDYYTVFDDNKETISSEFLDLMQISRYAYLIADRDRDEGNEEFKPRLKNIIDRIDFLPNDQKKYIEYHVTKGREIENYVSREIFTKALCHETFNRKNVSYKEKGIKITIELDPPSLENLPQDFLFTYNDSFDIKFTRLYLTNEQIKQHKLDPDINSQRYNDVVNKLTQKFNKVTVAKHVINFYQNPSDLGKEENDLHTFIKDLVKYIKDAQ